MGQLNKSLKRTLQKLEDDPNYQFHSAWHRDRHLQAREDAENEDRVWDVIGLVASLVCIPLIILFMMSVS